MDSELLIRHVIEVIYPFRSTILARGFIYGSSEYDFHCAFCKVGKTGQINKFHLKQIVSHASGHSHCMKVLECLCPKVYGILEPYYAGGKHDIVGELLKVITSLVGEMDTAWPHVSTTNRERVYDSSMEYYSNLFQELENEIFEAVTQTEAPLRAAFEIRENLIAAGDENKQKSGEEKLAVSLQSGQNINRDNEHANTIPAQSTELNISATFELLKHSLMAHGADISGFEILEKDLYESGLSQMQVLQKHKIFIENQIRIIKCASANQASNEEQLENLISALKNFLPNLEITDQQLVQVPEAPELNEQDWIGNSENSTEEIPAGKASTESDCNALEKAHQSEIPNFLPHGVIFQLKFIGKCKITNHGFLTHSIKDLPINLLLHPLSFYGTQCVDPKTPMLIISPHPMPFQCLVEIINTNTAQTEFWIANLEF